MSNPEHNPEIPKDEILDRRLIDLMLEMMLKDVIDPRKGTSFVLLQGDDHFGAASWSGDFSGGEAIATFGTYDPIEARFEKMTLTEEEIALKHRLANENMLDKAQEFRAAGNEAAAKFIETVVDEIKKLDEEDKKEK